MNIRKGERVSRMQPASLISAFQKRGAANSGSEFEAGSPYLAQFLQARRRYAPTLRKRRAGTLNLKYLRLDHFHRRFDHIHCSGISRTQTSNCRVISAVAHLTSSL